jgi:hypothetical protein
MRTIYLTKGSTYRDTLRWATSECLFTPATLKPGAPVLLEAPGHGIPNGWEIRVEGCMDISPLRWHSARVVDSGTLAINCLNGTRFRECGVVLRHNAPVDLQGYEARMQIRRCHQGELLLELDSHAGLGLPRIVIDEVEHTIVREIPASITEALDWTRGVFDLEMIQDDYVIKIDGGDVLVFREVTTS